MSFGQKSLKKDNFCSDLSATDMKRGVRSLPVKSEHHPDDPPNDDDTD